MLGALLGMARTVDVSNNLKGSVLLRDGLQPGQGFVGAYADDLMLGHMQHGVLTELLREVESFYRTIGCSLSLAKSRWMTVSGVTPPDTSHAREEF